MAGQYGSESARDRARDPQRQGKPGSGYQIVPGTETGSSITQYSLVGSTPGGQYHGGKRFGSIPAAQDYMAEHGLEHYVKPYDPFKS